MSVSAPRCPTCGDLLLTSSLGLVDCSCGPRWPAESDGPIVGWLRRRPDPFAEPDNADKYGDPLAGEYEDSEG